MQVLVIAILLKIVMKRRFSIIQVGKTNRGLSMSYSQLYLIDF